MIWCRKMQNSELIKSMSWMLASSIIGNLLRFLLILVVIRCYSQEEFGLWASITSIAAIIITGDFGLTNVLRNIASQGLSKGEEGDLYTKECYFSVLCFFTIIAFIGALIIILFYHSIPFHELFKTNNETIKSQSNIICTIVLLIFLFNIPLGIASGMFFSYGETKFSAIFGLVNGILTFIIISIMGYFGISIVVSAISYFAISLIINLFITLYFIWRRKWYKEISLKPKNVYQNLKFMIPLGIKFMLYGLASSFISNVLTIYSGSMLGLIQAANINVAQKIFTFFVGLIQCMFNPIWAKLSLLYFNKDYFKAKLLLQRSLIFTLSISSFVILFATSISQFLVRIVATSEYKADYILFFLVGVCSFMKIIFDNSSLLLTAISKLNFIMVGYGVFTTMVAFLFPCIVNKFGFDLMMVTLSCCWILFSILAVVISNRLINSKLIK